MRIGRNVKLKWFSSRGWAKLFADKIDLTFPHSSVLPLALATGERWKPCLAKLFFEVVSEHQQFLLFGKRPAFVVFFLIVDIPANGVYLRFAYRDGEEIVLPEEIIHQPVSVNPKRRFAFDLLRDFADRLRRRKANKAMAMVDITVDAVDPNVF